VSAFPLQNVTHMPKPKRLLPNCSVVEFQDVLLVIDLAVQEVSEEKTSVTFPAAQESRDVQATDI